MATKYISENLVSWLEEHADSLDQSNLLADEVLYRLVEGGVFKHGVPTALGGNGNTLQDAIQAITEVARYSLTAAFCFWGHRTLLENVLHSQSPVHQALVPELLSGKRAGGTALSNAVKFVSGVEPLNVTIREENGKRYLSGRLPWITNLRADRFAIIFAADFEDKSKTPIVLAIPSEVGLQLQEELPLVALKASHTHPVVLDNLELNPDWIISDNLLAYLGESRTAFLGLQFGMAFGLAERSLSEVEKAFKFSRDVLKPEWQEAKDGLIRIQNELQAGIEARKFVKEPRALFQLRIDIVDVVAKAILLELQAGGGRGYLENTGSSFIRRWREAAFLPIVTPSAVQLRLVLDDLANKA